VSDDVEVYVAVGEENFLAGRMYPHRRRGIESASFVYNDRYLADPGASPAFDLNPNPHPGSKDLSTAIDYTDTRASVDTLMSVAAYFRLDASDALEVLAKVTRAVARWRTVAKSHGLLQQDLDVMKLAFEHSEGERARALAKIRPARAS